ncbi:MAG: hypothetical protein HQK54_05855, partial [Oligoflexales bacterium]|nr:hypothetical protein [Oligoflexales bacterium]
SEVAAKLTTSVVEGIKDAGIPAKDLKTTMNNLMKESVSALKDAGVASNEVGTFVGPMMTAAVSGLNTLGAKSLDMQNIVGKMMEGAVGSLSSAGVETAGEMKAVLGDCIQGAMKGVADAGTKSAEIAGFMDDILKGTVSALSDTGIKSASDFQVLAASATTFAISFADDVGVIDATALGELTKAIATGTTDALGEIAKDGFMSKEEVASATGDITKAATDAIIMQSRDSPYTNFSASDLSTISASFSSGLADGLGNQGWLTSEIQAIQDDVALAAKEAMTLSGGFDDSQLAAFESSITAAVASAISEQMNRCAAEKGTWHPEGYCEYPMTEPPPTALIPTEAEEENCSAVGGIITYLMNGTYFCDYISTASGGSSDSSGDTGTPTSTATATPTPTTDSGSSGGESGGETSSYYITYAIFSGETSVLGGAIPVPPLPVDEEYWLAPYGTTDFTEGATMTCTNMQGTTGLHVPLRSGTYYLYRLDAYDQEILETSMYPLTVTPELYKNLYQGWIYDVFADSTNSNKLTVQVYSGSGWSTVGTSGFTAYAQDTSYGYPANMAVDQRNGNIYVVYSSTNYRSPDSFRLVGYLYKYTRSTDSWSQVWEFPNSALGPNIYIMTDGTKYLVYKTENSCSSGSGWCFRWMKSPADDDVYSNAVYYDYPDDFSSAISMFASDGVIYAAVEDNDPASSNDKLSVYKYDTAATFSPSNILRVGTGQDTAYGVRYPSIYVRTTALGAAPFVIFGDQGLGYTPISVRTFDGTSWNIVGSAGFTPRSGPYMGTPWETSNSSVMAICAGDNDELYGVYSVGFPPTNKSWVVKWDGTNWLTWDSIDENWWRWDETNLAWWNADDSTQAWKYENWDTLGNKWWNKDHTNSWRYDSVSAVYAWWNIDNSEFNVSDPPIVGNLGYFATGVKNPTIIYMNGMVGISYRKADGTGLGIYEINDGYIGPME